MVTGIPSDVLAVDAASRFWMFEEATRHWRPKHNTCPNKLVALSPLFLDVPGKA